MSANGTGPMTVYNYVKDRDELEELVAAAVLDDVKLAGPSADWLADVIANAIAMRRAVRSHPNAVPRVLIHRTASAVSYLAAERLMGR